MSKQELIVAGFSYSAVDKDQGAKLRYCAGEIQKGKACVAGSIMTIGEMLCVAQETLAKNRVGTFQKWIESECGFSKATAYRYMDAYRAFVNCLTVRQLEDSSIYTLAQKDTPEKARKEVLKLAEKSGGITQKQVKAIIKKYKSTNAAPGGSGDDKPKPAKPEPPALTKEEQLKLELKKARSYAEYLQRSVDDLNRLKRNTVIHPKLVQSCIDILEGLDRW